MRLAGMGPTGISNLTSIPPPKMPRSRNYSKQLICHTQMHLRDFHNYFTALPFGVTLDEALPGVPSTARKFYTNAHITLQFFRIYFVVCAIQRVLARPSSSFRGHEIGKYTLYPILSSARFSWLAGTAALR